MNDGESGGSTCKEAAPADSVRRARGRGLTFINAAHPADALSRQALSNIRAHVARDAHARGRRVRGATAARTGPGRSEQLSSPSGGNGRAQVSGPSPERGADANDATGAGDVGEPDAVLAPSAAEELGGGFVASASVTRRDAGAQSLAALSSRLDDVAWSWDPFQSFARPVSDTEAFLIDHYVNYAIRYDRACCQSADRALRVVLRSVWVPFALSDEGALAAVLTQACRSVLELLPQRGRYAREREREPEPAAASTGATVTASVTPTEAYYSRLMLVYKGFCISSIKASLSREWPHVSDATIAKSIIMGTEERIAGNLDGWLAHSFAVSRMAEQRGGPSRLGIPGFLARGAGECIELTQRFSGQGVNLPMRPTMA
ncbi:hypothetical protein RB595_004416 [Gaeumannomyces hyphopodioides]